MPQLDLATFPSQIFWLVLGFALFYVISCKWIAPSLGSTILKRNDHIKIMEHRTAQVNEEAHALENEALDMLEQSVAAIEASEEAERARIRKLNAQLRSEMAVSYHNSIAEDSRNIQKMSEKAYSDIQSELNKFVDVALEKVKKTFEVRGVG